MPVAAGLLTCRAGYQLPAPRLPCPLLPLKTQRQQKNSSHLGGSVTRSGLSLLKAFLLDTASFFPLLLPLKLFPPFQQPISAGFDLFLFFKGEAEMESSEESSPLPPHSPFAVAAVFCCGFTLVRQCSSFTCWLQCGSCTIPCSLPLQWIALLFLLSSPFLVAALVKKDK